MSQDLQKSKHRIATAILLWNLVGGGVLAFVSLLSFPGASPRRLGMAILFLVFGVLSGIINRRNYLRSAND